MYGLLEIGLEIFQKVNLSELTGLQMEYIPRNGQLANENAEKWKVKQIQREGQYILS